MIPLFRESVYRFPFGERRLVKRVHLAGAQPGRCVEMCLVDSHNEAKPVAHGTIDPDGWVDLTPSLVTQPGDLFLARVVDSVSPATFTSHGSD